MALFGGQRDMALFSKINKELITDIIDTEVYYYKIIVEDMKISKNESIYKSFFLF